jgi:hypothetical protein
VVGKAMYQSLTLTHAQLLGRSMIRSRFLSSLSCRWSNRVLPLGDEVMILAFPNWSGRLVQVVWQVALMPRRSFQWQRQQ